MNIDQILEKMALQEKVSLCIGASFWQTKEMPEYGIPAVFMCDGPHGVRKQENEADMLGINESVPATCFPTAVTTACSWDEELLGKIGNAIAEEALANHVDIVLGPGANIKRNPLCGRNFEYFSEDPHLSGKLAAAFIRAAERKGAGTSLKHFACNNQEYKRFSSNSIMDERTLREIYLPAFETAVKKGKPSTVMCSYNQINGTHSSDNKMLLTDILRNEWGFEGFVMTDWGGMHDRIRGFHAGCDLTMPGGSKFMEREVIAAVQEGLLPVETIDCSVRRLLTFIDRVGENKGQSNTYDQAEHHILAKQAAENSAVLLKNEGVLPLDKKKDTVLIGYMAKKLRYQGSGSSHINPTKLTTVKEAMPDARYVSGYDEEGNTDESLIIEAVAAARSAKQVVIIAGLPDKYESEGFDREHMQMPQGQLEVIEAVSKVNANVIVVLLCGSVVETPWADHVNAVLYMGLPGQAGGEAVAELLYGNVNPGGKLAESWPLKYEDCPSAAYYSQNRKDAQYRESIYVGYRYYETAKVPVRWCFGHGLSYTEFEYSDLKVEKNRVRCTVRNIGMVDGAEVAQLYIAPPEGGLHRPQQELKGFRKVFLRSQESKEIEFVLDDRSFTVWNKGWNVIAGSYTIQIGSSVQDIRLEKQMKIDGIKIPAPKWQQNSWYEAPTGTPLQEEWERMLGWKYEAPVLQKGRFTMENTVLEMKDYSLVMRLMCWGVEKTVAKGFDGKVDYNNPDFRMLMASSADCSLSSMEISGGLSPGLMKGMLQMANGHMLKGILCILRGR